MVTPSDCFLPFNRAFSRVRRQARHEIAAMTRRSIRGVFYENAMRSRGTRWGVPFAREGEPFCVSLRNSSRSLMRHKVPRLDNTPTPFLYIPRRVRPLRGISAYRRKRSCTVKKSVSPFFRRKSNNTKSFGLFIALLYHI